MGIVRLLWISISYCSKYIGSAGCAVFPSRNGRFLIGSVWGVRMGTWFESSNMGWLSVSKPPTVSALFCGFREGELDPLKIFSGFGSFAGLSFIMGEAKEVMKSMMSEGSMCVGISSQLGASKSSQDDGKKLFWMGWASNDDDSLW
jgi:hypothetical protein